MYWSIDSNSALSMLVLSLSGFSDCILVRHGIAFQLCYPGRNIQVAKENGQHEAGRHHLDSAGLHVFDAVDEGLQLAAAAGVTQLTERLGFYLADALAGD